MPYISVDVDVFDVLHELEDEDIQKEVERRSRVKAPPGSKPVGDNQLLEQVWWHFRDRSDAPPCLREYIWRVLGKAL